MGYPPGSMVITIQRHMGRQRKPCVVFSTLLQSVHDWISWLVPLDDLKPDAGISGHCIEGSANWLCWTRREDVLVEWVDKMERPGVGQPADVMLMVKRYMADAHVSKQILLFVHAGANFRLPDHPLTWQAKDPMSKEYTDGLGHLLDLVTPRAEAEKPLWRSSGTDTPELRCLPAQSGHC